MDRSEEKEEMDESEEKEKIDKSFFFKRKFPDFLQ